MPIKLNGTTILDESNYATTSQLSALESTLKTYTDNKVVNMLKTMNWSSAVEFTLQHNTQSYTVSKDGYVIYTNTNGYTNENTLTIAGKQVGMISTGSSDYSRDSLMTTGTTFQVSSGSTISLGTNPASSTLVVKFLFVPFK